MTEIKSKNQQQVEQYYESVQEEERMAKDNAHMVEFWTGMHYILKYLHKEDKVLEVGCATGIYSLEIAKRGYEVTAVDISERNLEVLESKKTKDMKIQIENRNATNLKGLKDNSFDMALELGPMYHLFSEEDMDAAIEEVKRVTKPDGVLFFSFLSKDYIIMRRCKEMFEESEYYLDENYEYKNQMSEIFYYASIEEITQLMEKHSLKIEHIVSMDGISQFIGDQINQLSKEGYERFLQHHLNNCERKELLGYCPHILCGVRNDK